MEAGFQPNDSPINEPILSDENTCEPSEENKAELEKFISLFKQHRMRIGLSQKEVGIVLGAIYGIEFSQSTISRFEAMTLPWNMAFDIRGKLANWVVSSQMTNATPRENYTSSTVGHLRRKRTNLTRDQKEYLQQHFERSRFPSQQELSSLADQLGLNLFVVRNWFNNMRQKDRKNIAGATTIEENS